MKIDGDEFNDDLSAIQGRENLWRAVLMNALEEAISGVNRGDYNDPLRRATLIREARNYVTVPNSDFDIVCSLAGLDPEAVRECAAKQIAVAPTPEELVLSPRKSRNASREKGTRKPRRDVVRHEHEGMTLTIGEWSKHTGVPDMTIRQRLAAGWPIDRAIEKMDGRISRNRVTAKRPKEADHG